jgi:hypothetical protein
MAFLDALTLFAGLLVEAERLPVTGLVWDDGAGPRTRQSIGAI